jgi:hypothetical protein
MNLPYLFGKVREKIFGDEDELSVKDFKARTSKLRMGGKDWLEFGKDLEELKMVRIKGQRIKLEK